MRRFLERLLNLLRVRRPDHDLARELDAHLALLQDAYEARGLSPDAARRAARLALGNVDHVKALHRDARSFRWIEDASQDAAHGVRLLRRSPVFTATAALSLAIGIGANTAIFTVANALLFRPPAGITDPSELVVIGTARGDGGVNPLNSRVVSRSRAPHDVADQRVRGRDVPPRHGHGAVRHRDRRAGSRSVRHREFLQRARRESLSWAGVRRRRRGRGRPRLRLLEATIQQRRRDGRPDAAAQWAARHHRRRRCARLPGHRDPAVRCVARHRVRRHVAGSRLAGGRVRPGVSFDTALAELTTVGESINRDQGSSGERTRRLGALQFSRAGENRNIVRGFAAALMALVSLVLAAACANVAGIMLTRSTARAREIALRAALGAGRGRLVRQLLTETIVLFLFSSLLGVGLARGLTHMAMLMLPALPTSIVVPLAMDWRVLLFALLLSIGAALGIWCAAGLQGLERGAGSSLKDGVRSSSGRSRLRSAFVVGQIACSVLLVVLGASFVRVLRHAGAADPGFDSRGVDIATLDLSVTGEPKAGTAAFWRTVIDRVRQTPAVESASLARVPPGGFEGIGLGGVAPGDQPGTTDMFSPAWNIVDTGYFATLRIPIVAGRDFAPSDTNGAQPVVIVSETLARRFWPGQPAIGKPLRLAVFNARDRRAETRVSTVVGVAGNIRSSSLIDGLAEPYVYLPLAQSDALGSDMTTQMSIVARRRGDASLAAAMAIAVQDVDQRLVLARTESLVDSIALGLTPQRILATIGGVMGLVALLLASMGIYGVTAYTVALRRREFAIRLALGSPRARVVQMVFRQSTWLVAVGLGIGLAVAIGVGQVLSAFLYGLPAAHMPTLLGTVTLFLAVGATASVVPAGQAVREGWRRALQEE